jgi:predicted AlkP superfamily pyrophosphatase or phosphodiesterase
MIPSFPTETFPNHYAMVTGLYPDHSGIVGNQMEEGGSRADLVWHMGEDDPEWFKDATPIWVAEQRSGGTTAELYWPRRIAHHLRDHFLQYSPQIGPIMSTYSAIQLLDKPYGFIAMYFSLVDQQGHIHGPNSREVNKALHDADAGIGRLVAALKKRGMFETTDIVIVSDHGMSALHHTVYIDDFTKDHVVMTGGVAGIDGDVKELPHAQCWNKHHIPPRFHYGSNPRVPQTICLAQDGWRLTTHAAARKHEAETWNPKGGHGYDNADPNMRSIFIAEGPDFRRGYVSKPFPNVDVYLILAHLLGVTPAPNDGNISDVDSMFKP